jgi:hypothetical protein
MSNNSDRIKKELSEEENDFKAFGLHCKLIREERSDKFEDSYLPKLKDSFKVAFDANMGKYSISTDDGIVDFYPKANKLLIRKSNKWVKPGLKWLLTNLLTKSQARDTQINKILD